MPVRTCRIDDSIVFTLPDSEIITDMVSDIKMGKVRIGIDAPLGVEVLRDKIESSNGNLSYNFLYK